MKGFLIVISPLLILGVLAIGYLVWSQSRFDSYHANCAEAGGHIYKPDSVSFCVSDDGRWIEVYP